MPGRSLGRILLSLALLVGASACENEPSAAEMAARSEADVAMVREAQNRRPPLEELYPEPITRADIDRGDLFAASCTMQHPSGAHALALAFADNGYLKIDGELVRFAADKGSVSQPLDTWSKYDGREYSFSLRLDKAEAAEGHVVENLPARMLVRDRFDRIVFDYSGTARCGEG